MNQDLLKQKAAQKAFDYISPKIEKNWIIGIGTGSTTNHFISLLGGIKSNFLGAVSSSLQSTKLLQNLGIKVFELSEVEEIPVYIDGADEVNSNFELIKGGGGALTREKIIATQSKEFICIVDESKLVSCLGSFPLPVEYIPCARTLVQKKAISLKGSPEIRKDFVTDNGAKIIDIKNLQITNPSSLESQLNQIPGVLTNGIFSHRKADILIIASEQEILLKKTPHK